MASQLQDNDLNQQGDLGNIDAPIEDKTCMCDATTGSNPFCQRSHGCSEEERASERALEPLLAIMQATAAALATEGEPMLHPKIFNPEHPADRDYIFECFTRGMAMRHRKASELCCVQALLEKIW